MHRKPIRLAATAALAWMLSGPLRLPAGTHEKTGPELAAVERARDTVKLIDTMHKTYVVEITATYVGE